MVNLYTAWFTDFACIFVHYLPAEEEDSIFVSSESSMSESDSDSDVVEGCGSPRMPRKKRLKKFREKVERRDSLASQRPIDELLYDDNLPEVRTFIYNQDLHLLLS